MKFRAYLALTFTFSSFHVIHLCDFSPLSSFLSLYFHFNVLFVCIHAELQIMATPRIVCCSLCQPSDIENTHKHRQARTHSGMIRFAVSSFLLRIHTIHSHTLWAEIYCGLLLNKWSCVFVLVRQKAGHGLAKFHFNLYNTCFGSVTGKDR